jgi:hypothetical protein
MGIKQKSNSIYNFDIDGNGCDLIWKMDSIFQDFAISTYKNNKLIISGGSNYSVNTGKNNVYELELLWNQNKRMIECKFSSLAQLKQRRFKHCQFITNDYLFVFFGY